MTGIFKTMAKAAQKRRNFLATVETLNAMNERQLNDIGIQDGDIRRAARSGIHGA